MPTRARAIFVVATVVLAASWSIAAEHLPFAILDDAPKAADARPTADAEPIVQPQFLAAVDEPPSVYPETLAPRAQDTNAGGVNFGLDVDWFTDYVYRGVDQNTPGRRPENSLQFDAFAKFDLGKLPHPFIGLFVNVFNADPVSRFEEVRPYVGLDWNLKPFTITGGFNSYIFPNRKNLDTQEVFAEVAFDDGSLFHTTKPILGPYVYGAYDYDLYKGFYIEAGLKHEFVFEDLGATLSPTADVAYVVNQRHFEISPMDRSYGFQHYELGAVGSYSLNHAFNVDRRYGEWSVQGFIFYSARIDKNLRADTLVYGGTGLEFRY